MPPSRLAAFLAALVAFTIHPVLTKAACINWPEVMTKSELGRLPQGKVLVVTSFANQSGNAADFWMTFGLRDLLVEYLRSAKRLRVIREGMSGSLEETRVSVDGSFQRLADRLRIFVSATQNGELLKQFAIDVPSPGHREMFEQLAHTASEIAKLFKSPIDDQKLDTLRKTFSLTKSFEAYTKGRNALLTYTLKGAKEAVSHFEEVKRTDFRSPIGYQGLIDADTFIGLLLKQERKPFGVFFQRAGDELVQMTRLAHKTPDVPSLKKPKPEKKKEPSVTVDNRFLKGHALFVEGLHAEQKGDLQAARDAFRNVVKLVPEDALAWYHLSRFDERLGNASRASEELARALAINPCLGKE